MNELSESKLRLKILQDFWKSGFFLNPPYRPLETTHSPGYLAQKKSQPHFFFISNANNSRQASSKWFLYVSNAEAMDFMRFATLHGVFRDHMVVSSPRRIPRQHEVDLCHMTQQWPAQHPWLHGFPTARPALMCVVS
jgi:hypothetical protein